MCKYCEPPFEPLTDLEYEDGTKFDDLLSLQIQFFGKRALIVAKTKKKAFDMPGITNKFSDDQIQMMMVKNWAVEIDFCPKCGDQFIK